MEWRRWIGQGRFLRNGVQGATAPWRVQGSALALLFSLLINQTEN